MPSAALAEAAGHEDAVDVLEEGRRVLALEHFGLDPVEIDLDLVGDAAVRERLDQRLVGVLHPGVLADHRDRHLPFRIADALVDEAPDDEIRRRRALDAEGRKHLVVEAGLMIGLRHRIDVVGVARLDHGGFAHVAEQAELAALLARDRPVGAAEQDVGLDTDRAQLLHRVLRRLGLELAGAGDERQQREVDVDRVMARQVVAELADGRQSRSRRCPRG